jgi:uridine kinase
MSLLIGIAGGSGSGKTTLAKGVAAALPPGQVVVIPHDAYYRDLGHWPVSDRMGCNFDEPAALDNERLVEDLRNLRSGMAITRPNYDFATHTRLAQTIRVEAGPVVIVEGILVLAVAALCEVLDLKVFVETSEPIRLARRIERDVDERGRTREAAEIQYQRTTRPMHERYVAPSRACADVVVSGEASAECAVESVTTAILRLAKPGIQA